MTSRCCLKINIDQNSSSRNRLLILLCMQITKGKTHFNMLIFFSSVRVERRIKPWLNFEPSHISVFRRNLFHKGINTIFRWEEGGGGQLKQQFIFYDINKIKNIKHIEKKFRFFVQRNTFKFEPVFLWHLQLVLH